MKKLLFLFAFAFVYVSSVNAQSSAFIFTSSGDTVTNTETENLQLKVSNPYDIVTIQYVAQKLTGTVAGTATLQGSLDGVNYVNAMAADSIFTNTNVTTQTTIWYVQPGRYLHYRIKCTGSGTMAARVYGYAITR